MSALDRVLTQARGPVLVVGDRVATSGEVPVEVVPPGTVLARGRRFATVVLVADDLVDLRRTASLCDGLGRARAVAAVVAGGVRGVLPLVVHPGWPPVVSLNARRDDGAAVTVAGFARPVPVASVAAALAAGAAPGTRTGPAGLRVALPSLPGGPAPVPPADTTVAVVVDRRPGLPPDVVVGAGGPLPASDVTGTAPLVLSAAEVGVPLDEVVFNPRGFTRRTRRGVVDLPPGTRPTAELVRSLRDAAGVRVPGADPVLVAALEMSGVPVLGRGTEPADLDDPAARERRSVRRRRAALAEHSTVSWRARLAARAGVRVATHPSVSVVVTPAAGESAVDVEARGRRQVVTLPGAEVEVLVDDGAVRPSGDLLLRLAADADPPPDLLTDLLLARGYSGARTVGRPPRPRDAETWGQEAVGPLLVDRLAGEPSEAPVYRIHAVDE